MKWHCLTAHEVLGKIRCEIAQWQDHSLRKRISISILVGKTFLVMSYDFSAVVVMYENSMPCEFLLALLLDRHTSKSLARVNGVAHRDKYHVACNSMSVSQFTMGKLL